MVTLCEEFVVGLAFFSKQMKKSGVEQTNFNIKAFSWHRFWDNPQTIICTKQYCRPRPSSPNLLVGGGFGRIFMFLKCNP